MIFLTNQEYIIDIRQMSYENIKVSEDVYLSEEEKLLVLYRNITQMYQLSLLFHDKIIKKYEKSSQLIEVDSTNDIRSNT